VLGLLRLLLLLLLLQLLLLLRLSIPPTWDGSLVEDSPLPRYCDVSGLVDLYPVPRSLSIFRWGHSFPVGHSMQNTSLHWREPSVSSSKFKAATLSRRWATSCTRRLTARMVGPGHASIG